MENDPETAEGAEELSDDLSGAVKDPPNLKNQLTALGILLLVFGAFYLVAEFLPTVIDEAGDGMRDRFFGSAAGGGENPGEGNAAPGEEGGALAKSTGHASPEKDGTGATPVSSPGVTATTATSGAGWPISEDTFRGEIVRQLGGPERAEVQQLAINDTQTRVVVALRLTPAGGEPRLLEIFLERDEFGRFVTGEDSPVDTPVKIWTQ